MAFSKDLDPQLYDSKVVSLISLYSDGTYAIHPSKLYRYFYMYVWRALASLFKAGSVRFGKKGNEYNLCNADCSPVSAKAILKKYGGKPDAIMLHWVDGFVSSKVLADLHRLTGAPVVEVFTDEFPLGGGCHYPCSCEGYKDSCADCPGAVCKKAVARQFAAKKNNFKDIPCLILAPSAACKKASESAIFSSSKTVRSISPVKSFDYDRAEARKAFGLAQDDFVILFGATNLQEKRKGLQLFKDAMKAVQEGCSAERRITLLVAGTLGEGALDQYPSVNVVVTGFLNFESLMKAFKAADVYASPTYADSGPMMVNYSVGCGTPVVAFNIGIAQDLVVPGKTGYVAAYKDSADFAQGLLAFYRMSAAEIESYRANCKELTDKLNSEDVSGLTELHSSLCSLISY